MKITEWSAAERPREKLIRHGASSLSDAELLAIFLRTGIPGLNAVELAQSLLQQFGSLRNLLNASQQAFCSGKGLGEAKYVQLQACLEMSQRHLAEKLTRDNVFDSSAYTERYLISKMRDLPHEQFVMLTLDSQYRLLHFRQMFSGTIDAASVYPRELVKQALADNAAAIIVAHNHPSGVAEPSMADKRMTQQIREAMQLMDIQLLDHFVIGDSEAVSFAQRGWL